MIRVNLLPPEHRPVQGTPIGRFVAIVAGVVLVVGAGCFYAWTHFVQLRGARELKVLRESELASKEVLKQRSLDLQKELDQFQERRRAIQTINRSRVLWSRKLDQFFDVVAHRDAPYSAWLDDLEVPNLASPSRGAVRGAKAGEDGGRFRFAGFLAMQQTNEALAQGSLFYRAITGEGSGQASEFFSDFLQISNPAIDTGDSERESNLTPPVVGAVRYELRLQPRQLDPKKPPKGPAAAGQPAVK